MASDPRLFFKLHNGFPEHPKTIELSDKAFRHLVEAWCYCSRNLNDGKLTKAQVSKLFSAKTRRELTEVGFLVEDGLAFEMHDYLEHQESAADVENRRNKRVMAGSKGGKAKANNLASASPLVEQTPSKPVADKDKDEDRDIATDVAISKKEPVKDSEDFIEFYLAYPRHEGRGNAVKAYAKALAKTDASTILEGAQRYADDPNRDPAFTKLPATWLNAESWSDDPLPARFPNQQPQRSTHADRVNSKHEALIAKLAGQTDIYEIGA